MEDELQFSEKNKFSHNQNQIDNKQSLFNVGEYVLNRMNDTAIRTMIEWRGVETLVYRQDNKKNQPRKDGESVEYDLSKMYRGAYGVFGDSFTPSDRNYDFVVKVLIYQDKFTIFDRDDVLIGSSNTGYILSDFEFQENDIIKVLRNDLQDRFFLIVSQEQFGTTQSTVKKYNISNYNK